MRKQTDARLDSLTAYASSACWQWRHNYEHTNVLKCTELLNGVCCRLCIRLNDTRMECYPSTVIKVMKSPAANCTSSTSVGRVSDHQHAVSGIRHKTGNVCAQPASYQTTNPLPHGVRAQQQSMRNPHVVGQPSKQAMVNTRVIQNNSLPPASDRGSILQELQRQLLSNTSVPVSYTHLTLPTIYSV